MERDHPGLGITRFLEEKLGVKLGLEVHSSRRREGHERADQVLLNFAQKGNTPVHSLNLVGVSLLSEGLSRVPVQGTRREHERDAFVLLNPGELPD